MGGNRRTVYWVKSAKEELLTFPVDARRKIGYDLGLVQDGEMPEGSSQLHGINPAVIELRANHNRSTYRCIVTVRLKHYVYALCAFQKKSVRGTKTPQPDIDLIEHRLQAALELDAQFEREVAS